MSVKKKTPSEEAHTEKKSKKGFVQGLHAQSIVISGKNGHTYLTLNALVGIIFTLLFPYITAIIFIISLIGWLDIQLISKHPEKTQESTEKKETKTPKTPLKTMKKKE